MKQFQIVLLFFCVAVTNYSFASKNTTYNSVTLFNFDASCMQEYEYEVDEGFIIDDNHKAYHVRIDAERTLVLKVFNKTEGLSELKTHFTVLHDCKSVKGLQPQFVIGVNNNSSPVFIKRDGLYYKVFSSEYNTDNDAFFSSFAPPHQSFVYEYHHEYDPLETLRPVGLDALDYDTRNFYYSTAQERESYNFVYLQMYRDVCANRPYGIVTPLSAHGEENDYKYETPENNTKSITTERKQVYRTCQHPVSVKHIKRLGTAWRSYEEDGTLYSSKLVSIDGVDLETYLETHSFESENTHKSADLDGAITWEYKLTGNSPVPASYQPSYIVNSVENKKDISSPINTEKGVKKELPTTYGSTVPENSSNKVTLQVPDVTIDGIKHKVEKGETLYSISQKYDVSVLDLKIDNQLNENTIEIGQELTIGKK